MREWREEARFAKLMYLVARVAGSDCEIDDFLPPHPTDKPAPTADPNRQHALLAYLKSCSNSK